MRTVPRCALFALLLVTSWGCGKNASTTADSGTEGKKDVAAAPVGIEGDYVIVGGETMGDKSTPEEEAKMTESEKTVKISKDAITMMWFRKKPEALKYTLDASKSPAEIDITFPEDKGEPPLKSYGIYKLEGDTLTLFLWGSKEAKNRPKEFKTVKPSKELGDKDVGVMILILKKK